LDPEEPMPPKQSPTGPLSAVEIAAIRAWVTAGAPLATAAPAPADGADAGATTPTPAAAPSPAEPAAASADDAAPAASAALVDAATALLTQNVQRALMAHCDACHVADPAADAPGFVTKASRKWSGSSDLSGLHRWIVGAGASIADPDHTELM